MTKVENRRRPVKASDVATQPAKQKVSAPAPGDIKRYARCIKCKGKQEMKNVRRDQFKNGTKVFKGECVTCGTGLFLIVKKEVWEAFPG